MSANRGTFAELSDAIINGPVTPRSIAMNVTIRPQFIGKELQLTVNPIRKEEGLAEAAEAFAKTIGLGVYKLNRGLDRDNVPFLSFELGTGKEFVAFESFSP